MAKSILIIEDRRDTINMLSLVLKKSGYVVHGAETGENGLKMLKGKNIDLVILDLQLPGMSGEEFLSEIKKRKIKVKVAILTASKTSEEMKSKFKRKGASAYLTKPLSIDTIRKTIEKILGVKAKVEKKKTAKKITKKVTRKVKKK